MAKVWQLADDEETYGANAGLFIVVTDDDEEELSGPMSEDDAERLARLINLEEEAKQLVGDMHPIRDAIFSRLAAQSAKQESEAIMNGQKLKAAIIAAVRKAVGDPHAGLVMEPLYQHDRAAFGAVTGEFGAVTGELEEALKQLRDSSGFTVADDIRLIVIDTLEAGALDDLFGLPQPWIEEDAPEVELVAKAGGCKHCSVHCPKEETLLQVARSVRDQLGLQYLIDNDLAQRFFDAVEREEAKV